MSLLVVLALFLLLFGSVSGRLRTTLLTAPMVFVLFGMAIGLAGFGLFAFDFDSEVFAMITEITLVLVLFADAARIDLRSLLREQDLPIRMLTIGLTLTIVVGTWLALVLFAEFSLWEAAILATILTPTDAALAQSVISSPKLPVRVRQALNVESGLNDGIALPLLMLFLVLSGHFTGHRDANLALFAAMQLLLGPLVGAAVGFLGGKLLLTCHRRGWIDHSFLSLSAIALAILAFSGAELVGGNGFIAAFAAGFTIGNTAREVCMTLYHFAEAEGQLLVLFVFVVFASSMVPAVLPLLTWQMLIYALLSLSVVRMLPVALSLLGTKLMWETHVLLGWFGPRGIASIIYVLIVLGDAELPGQTTILAVSVVTILASVLLHGVSAVPLTRWYARMVEDMKREGEAETLAMPEMKSVSEMRTRRSG